METTNYRFTEDCDRSVKEKTSRGPKGVGRPRCGGQTFLGLLSFLHPSKGLLRLVFNVRRHLLIVSPRVFRSKVPYILQLMEGDIK